MNSKPILLLAAGIIFACSFTVKKDRNPLPGITVDFSKITGKINPLHGVNNGPFVIGVNADLNFYHREAAFPYTRLHDPRWPNPDVVDIPAIFPDFSADADDSSNYNFRKTDDYLAPIVKNGSQIIYRLGTSIEHHTQYFIHPPSDFKKWAKICVNIIRHYNEGWANGFYHRIKYWEIWNEPELKLMWLGTQQQYFELYETAAKAIKTHDPSLKVGGPATTGVRSVLAEPFLKYCREKSLPLDFFSWHAYFNNPYLITRDAKFIRKLLDQYGFTQTESHLNEWHYLTSWEELSPPKEQLEKYKTLGEKFAVTIGPKGAAYAASVLMLLQDCPIDVTNFYSADTNPYGMFDVFGAPGKVYYVFKAFNELTKTGNRVQCSAAFTDSTVVSCAGIASDNNTGTVLIANASAAAKSLPLQVAHFPGHGKLEAEIFLIDEKNTLSLSRKKTLTEKDITIQLNLPAYAVCQVKLKRITAGPAGK